jgi:hypothetical protein
VKKPSKHDYKKAFEALEAKYKEAVNRMHAAEMAWQLSTMMPPFDKWELCDRVEMSDHARALKEKLGDTLEVPTYRNSRYTVEVRELEAENPDEVTKCVYLSIKRNDKDAIGKERFRDFQRIKNELVSPEAEGIEIYPAESRLVDASNQYHMYCLVGARIPFGFQERLIVKGHNEDRAVPMESRQLGFDVDPPDALSIEELKEIEIAELEATDEDAPVG